MSCLLELIKNFNKKEEKLEEIVKNVEIDKRRKFFEIEIVAYNSEKGNYKKLYLSIPKYLLLRIRGNIYLDSYNKYLVKCNENKYVLSTYIDKKYTAALCNY